MKASKPSLQAVLHDPLGRLRGRPLPHCSRTLGGTQGTVAPWQRESSGVTVGGAFTVHPVAYFTYEESAKYGSTEIHGPVLVAWLNDQGLRRNWI